MLVKTDLLALTQNFLPADPGNYNYTLSVEFKLKSRFSLQLSGNVYKFLGDVIRQGHEIIPEMRYYLKNQFIGMYTSLDHFMNLFDDDVIRSSLPVEERVVAIGALYGYQREFGRFNFEGRLGIGIAHSYLSHSHRLAQSSRNSSLYFDTVFAPCCTPRKYFGSGRSEYQLDPSK